MSFAIASTSPSLSQSKDVHFLKEKENNMVNYMYMCNVYVYEGQQNKGSYLKIKFNACSTSSTLELHICHVRERLRVLLRS